MPAKAINISKNLLFDLYLERKLSTIIIAKQLSCNHVTVLNYLKKYGIPRRSKLGTRTPVILTKKVLLDLYQNKKLTQEEIAEKFGYSRYGVQRWMLTHGVKSRSYSEVNTKYKKSNFSGSLLEKAYLLGFRLGDLNVYKIRELIQVRCSSTIPEQIELIQELFKAYGNVHVWKAKRGTFEVVSLLNNTFNFLVPKEDKIESWILSEKKFFLSFLAGYSDAEGSIIIRTSSQGNNLSFAGFEIQTYDKKIINQIGKMLKALGLVFPNPYISRKAGHVDKRGVKSNGDSWRISIYKKESLWKLINWIEPYMKHKEKLNSLSLAKENIIARNSLPYCKPISLL